MKTSKKNTAFTAFFMVAAVLLAKVCGMLRDILIAAMYGTNTNEAVAFSTASRIPLLFFDIALGSAVTSAFIPIFNEYLEKDGRKKAIEFSNYFINLIVLITALMSIVGIVFSKQFVCLIAGGSLFSFSDLLIGAKLGGMRRPKIFHYAVSYTYFAAQTLLALSILFHKGV